MVGLVSAYAAPSRPTPTCAYLCHRAGMVSVADVATPDKTVASGRGRWPRGASVLGTTGTEPVRIAGRLC